MINSPSPAVRMRCAHPPVGGPVNGSKLKPLILGASAAIGIGIALTLQARGWFVIFGTDTCGSNRKTYLSRPDCPSYYGPVMMMSLFSLFSLGGRVPLAIYAIRKVGRQV